jgi:hypothetical protein
MKSSVFRYQDSFPSLFHGSALSRTGINRGVLFCFSTERSIRRVPVIVPVIASLGAVDGLCTAGALSRALEIIHS